jgi:hypothetical protein
MATYTVSSTGGNWNSAATWTTALANPATGPLAADIIIVPSGAGNLTINLNSSCLTITFQAGYVNTFTINNGITLTVTGTAITLVSGMNYATGTTGVLSTVSVQPSVAINFDGIVIPNLTLGRIGVATQTVTVSGTTPTVQNLVISNSVSNGTLALAGVSLTITSSFNLTLGLVNGTLLTFSGSTTITQAGASIANSITVSSGTLTMLSNLTKLGGTITFAVGTSLVPSTFTLTLTSATTLDTSNVTWYNVTLSATGANHILLSNLNISNNLSVTATSVFFNAFNINISGSLIATANFTLNSQGTINMIGSGTIETSGVFGAGTFNISGGSSYVLGSVTRPTLGLSNLTFKLLDTSVATVYSTTGHTLSLTGGALSVIDVNNTPTGNNVVGGSQILWGNLSGLINQPTTILTQTTFLGNFNSTQNTLNGQKIIVEGNLSVTTSVFGTSTIELSGSSNITWGAGAYQNNIIINKSGATVTLPTAGTITWGATARSLTYTAGIINTSTSTFSIPANIGVTMSGMPFYNLTLPGLATYVINTPISILNNLTLAATNSIAFIGSAGWTCANLLCSTPNRTITLANSSSGASYRTTSTASLLGTNAQRITMASDNATTQSIWTLDNGAQQSLVYVNGTRIDSSQGATIWSFGGTLTNTTNWGTGSAQATTAYTYVC